MLVEIELVPITCPECAGAFAISRAYKNQAREVGGFKHCWTCPYCKSERGYGKGTRQKELEELRRAKASAERTLEYREADLQRAREERDHQSRRAATYKGQVTKAKNRAAAGLCPCCNRSFQNLARHMKSQHPGYATQD